MKDSDGILKSFYPNDFSKWDKNAEIEYNNNCIRQKGRSEFFALAFDYLSVNDFYTAKNAGGGGVIPLDILSLAAIRRELFVWL